MKITKKEIKKLVKEELRLNRWDKDDDIPQPDQPRWSVEPYNEKELEELRTIGQNEGWVHRYGEDDRWFATIEKLQKEIGELEEALANSDIGWNG